VAEEGPSIPGSEVKAGLGIAWPEAPHERPITSLPGAPFSQTCGHGLP